MDENNFYSKPISINQLKPEVINPVDIGENPYVETKLPFWLYPLRCLIQKRIEKLKIEKDAEDMEMIYRREKLFGRGNNSVYLADHQFMLYKDDYVKHYGNFK